MATDRHLPNVAVVAAALLMIALASPSAAETTFGIYLGDGWTRDSDVRLQTITADALTFSSVSWDSEAFSHPLYYGVRVNHWLDSRPDWGIALDFLHAKMISKPSQVVGVSGMRGGAPVNVAEPLGDTYDKLEFSHGHNLLTINALRRWDLYRDPMPAGRRSYFHIGAGAGVALPHVEIITANTFTYEYQNAGPAAHVFAGINLRLSSRFLLTGEYKLSWAELEASLDGGGTLQADALTHNLTLGIGFDFGVNL